MISHLRLLLAGLACLASILSGMAPTESVASLVAISIQSPSSGQPDDVADTTALAEECEEEDSEEEEARDFHPLAHHTPPMPARSAATGVCVVRSVVSGPSLGGRAVSRGPPTAG